ncbi:MAG TPA: ion transporter [Prolixibacteraceae bacterium]|nr:ion transporter [Prolixibacteraceae bacterium]
MNWKDKLRIVVEENQTPQGRWFDLSIQALIVLSLISFSIETLPDLNAGFRNFLQFFEIITVIIFTIEYLLRLFVAKNKRQFVFSFYGIIDLLAILPFYLSFKIDLRSIRILRLFRLFRIFKIIRYSKAIRRFARAFLSIKEELVLFLILSSFLLFLSAVGIYYFENPAQPEVFQSVFHSMWWAVATLTTVGYGDIYPITVGGKIFTGFMLFIGLGVIAVPTGLIASALTKTKDDNSNSEK